MSPTRSHPHLARIFSSNPDFQVTNAFAFGDGHVVACIEVTDEDDWDLEASAVLRVRLDAATPWEILHVAHRQALNYYATSPDDHWLLLRGETLVRLRGSERAELDVPSGPLLTGLRPIAPGAMAVFGEQGACYRCEGGSWTHIPVATDRRIMEMWFDGPDRAYAVAQDGVVLTGTADGLHTPLVPPDALGRAHVLAVHASDGVVRLGGLAGGLRLEGGAVVRLEIPDDLAIGTVSAFRGVEYWGAPDFGVLTRAGHRLAKTHATGSVMTIQSTPAAMTLTAGHFVYVFDGATWTELQFRASPDDLVARIPLDFAPPA
ncbi:MAG: hypothetical protein R3F59_32115 [Myxococcota bacterium]